MTTSHRPIRVLIVDDSLVVRHHLKHILESDPDIRVEGMAEDGPAAIRFFETQRPDVVTMDINMPGMNGLDVIRQIMESSPVPIVVVSASYSPKDVQKTFLAMEAGAVAIAAKPAGERHPDYEHVARELVQTVRLMSEVKVVRRRNRRSTGKIEARGRLRREAAASLPAKEIWRRPGRFQVVAIGVSTGGPPALQTILTGLRKGYPAPVLIVQHIAKGFIGGLAEWLGRNSPLPVHVAVHREKIRSGHVYLAPDDFHLGIGEGGVIALSKAPPENGLRPSVSYLFRSVLNTFEGDVIGILLTGMGRDGAEELRLMKERGAVTIAQDRESSVVYGMPGEAVRLDAAGHVLPPERIAVLLENLAGMEWSVTGEVHGK